MNKTTSGLHGSRNGRRLWNGPRLPNFRRRSSKRPFRAKVNAKPLPRNDLNDRGDAQPPLECRLIYFTGDILLSRTTAISGRSVDECTVRVQAGTRRSRCDPHGRSRAVRSPLRY